LPFETMYCEAKFKNEEYRKESLGREIEWVKKLY
jgi:hypothetical protein